MDGYISCLAKKSLLVAYLFILTFVVGTSSVAGQRSQSLVATPATIHQFTAAVPQQSARFGESISVHGDRIAIGAWSEGPVGGAVYIFRRDAGKWVLEDHILGTGVNGAFGTSVAIQGDVLVVGAPSEEIDGGSLRGAVYVFRRQPNDDWTLEKRLARSDPTPSVRFGQSVAIDGDTIAATTWPTGFEIGSAHVFRRVKEDWVEEAVLRDETGIFANGFGINVDISGDTIVAGEKFGRAVAGEPGGGAVCVFFRTGTTWQLQERIPGPNTLDTRFGTSVSVLQDVLVVGAEDDGTGTLQPHKGAAYVYTRTGGAWTFRQKLTGFGTDSSSKFGTSVDQSANRIVVGARNTVVGQSEPGATFFFRLEGDTWTNGGKLVPSDLDSVNIFGWSVAVAGNKYFSSSPNRRVNGLSGAGSVDLYIEPPGAPDLDAASDSGIASTDNITNSLNLSFTITGAAPGALLELLRDGQVVGSVTAGAASNVLVDIAPPSGATYEYRSRQTIKGEVSSLSDRLYVTVDRVTPNVTVNQSAGWGDPTRDSTVSFYAELSEPVFGFDASDISLDGSTADVSNATVEFQPNTLPQVFHVSGIVSDGQYIRASVATGRFTDAAGNLNNHSTSTDNTITVDNVQPSVTIDQAEGQADPTANVPVRFKVEFSEPVTGFTGSDILFTGTANMSGRQVSVTGRGSVYEVAVTGFSSNGQTVVASVAGNTVDDALGNRNLLSTSTDNAITVDNVRPKVTINQAAGQPDPTSTFPIRFTVTFDEDISGFSAEDISLAASTVDVSSASVVITGAGPTYGVEISNVSGGGFLRPSILEGAVTDALDNPSMASTSVDNSVRIIPPFATIAGRVTTPQGYGVRLVRIVVTEPDGSKRYFQTNDFGYFNLRNIRTGRITLTLTRKPNRSLVQSFDLLEDLFDIQYVF